MSSFGIDCLRVSPARRVPTLLSSERPLVGLWSRSRETIGCSHRRNGRGICLFFFIYFFRLHWSLLASCLVSVCASVFAWGGGAGGRGPFFARVARFALPFFSSLLMMQFFILLWDSDTCVSSGRLCYTDSPRCHASFLRGGSCSNPTGVRC